MKLKAGQSIDYNNEATVALQITVTDSQGAPYTETLTIRVGDIQLNTYSFNENASGINVGDITVVGLDAGAGFTYSLSGEDARFFEITTDGVLKLKDGFEADYERDADYEITITAENDSGESLSTAIELSVEDVAEALESAYFSNDGGRNFVYYNSSSGIMFITVPEKNANEEVYLFNIDVVDGDNSGTYTLVVTSVSGWDVSDYFRFDSATGAVYLKPGYAVDFENSTGHYHAGTGALSYGHYGSDDPITDSVRPLIFSIKDDSGEQLLTWQQGYSSFDPLYVVLEFGDTSEDGSLEIGHTTENSEIFSFGNNDFSPSYTGTIVAAAGGKDITGDGIPDAVYVWDGDNGVFYLYIVPGGSRKDYGDFQDYAYFLTAWESTFAYTPTDIDLGDINGDGYADIILGFGYDYFEDFDHDYNGSLLDTDGMVEIVHGAPLETLIARENDQTWTSFLSPWGARDANFGNDIAVG
ncbi:MAG: hypothetical protein QGG39_15260, partial [Candidatus Poribacteria bacterium]|nr:hypothetical protein [Candidatus Poribacteria bacterium]